MPFVNQGESNGPNANPDSAGDHRTHSVDSTTVNSPAVHAKAIVAAVGGLITLVSGLLAQGNAQDISAAVMLVLTTIGVYRVPNKPKPYVGGE